MYLFTFDIFKEDSLKLVASLFVTALWFEIIPCFRLSVTFCKEEIGYKGTEML